MNKIKDILKNKIFKGIFFDFTGAIIGICSILLLFLFLKLSNYGLISFIIAIPFFFFLVIPYLLTPFTIYFCLTLYFGALGFFLKKLNNLKLQRKQFILIIIIFLLINSIFLYIDDLLMEKFLAPAVKTFVSKLKGK